MTYSGHGMQTEEKHDPKEGKCEEDGMDENIVPCDAVDSTNIISDNWLFSRVRNLPPDTKLICVFDACHSGTILDLPVCFQFEKMQHRLAHSYVSVSKQLEFENPSRIGNVICFSACRDSEVVEDFNHLGERAGPLNTAFLEVMYKHMSVGAPLTCRSIMNEMRNHDCFTAQKGSVHIKPQFSSLKVINVDKITVF